MSFPVDDGYMYILYTMVYNVPELCFIKLRIILYSYTYLTFLSIPKSGYQYTHVTHLGLRFYYNFVITRLYHHEPTSA